MNTIAYLINQYPQPSQSFIRREIAALETLGLAIERYTLRRWDGELVDEGDRAEQQRTRAVLGVGGMGLLMAMLMAAIRRPRKLWQTLRLAWRIGRRSERGLALHFIYVAEACVLIRWLRKARVRHVHAHFGTNSTTVAMLCHALGGPPFSFTAHGPEEFDKPEFLGLSEKIRRARFVVAISEFGRSQLFRWCGYSEWNKIHIVRCGVDDSFLAAAPVPVPQAPRLVCVGRLSEQKGQLLLIRAAGRLKIEGVKLEIVLIGDGPMRSEIELMIDQDDLKQEVRLAGWMSNAQVRQEIVSARAMVLPSFAEGLPVVIMESLALARPVISTYVAGIPELVVPNVSGWLVPPGSADALADAMRDALTAPTERLEHMGRAGAARVAERHNVITEARKLHALFRQTD